MKLEHIISEIDDALRLVQNYREKIDSDESALDRKVKKARGLLEEIRNTKEIYTCPTDEEIEESCPMVGRPRRNWIRGVEWLKSQIKTIPPELREQDLEEIMKKVDEHYSDIFEGDVENIYKWIIQHFNK